MTECKGAQGYDYVIGKSADLLQTREYEKVIKISLQQKHHSDIQIRVPGM